MRAFQPSTASLGDVLPLGFDAASAARWAANQATVRVTGYPMTGVYEDAGWAYYFVAPTRVVFLLKSPTKSYYPGGKPVVPGSTAYNAILKVLRQGTPLPEAAAKALLQGSAPAPKQDRTAPPAPAPSTAPLPPPPPTGQQLELMSSMANTPPSTDLPEWVPPVVVGVGAVLVLAGYFAFRSAR